jgi:hypothetical protein
MSARYSVLADSPRITPEGAAPRVLVIVSDDEGRSWRPYTPAFASGQQGVAYSIAEAMNAHAGTVESNMQGSQLRLLDEA